jgi:hypothetical protein
MAVCMNYSLRVVGESLFHELFIVELAINHVQRLNYRVKFRLRSFVISVTYIYCSEFVKM